MNIAPNSRPSGLRHARVPGLAEGLIWLSGFGIAGVAAELALSRHWQSPSQGIAWASVLLLAWGWASARRLVTAGPGRHGPTAAPHRRRVTWIAALATAIGVLGVWMHVSGNHEAGPLDAVYGGLWDGMSPWRQWWLALSMRVGPAPALASGALVLLAGMLWLAASADHAPD